MQVPPVKIPLVKVPPPADRNTQIEFTASNQSPLGITKDKRPVDNAFLVSVVQFHLGFLVVQLKVTRDRVALRLGSKIPGCPKGGRQR
jgi:hypothetical protein